MLFGKNRIDFLGLDNPEKIKGAEYTHIWLEEATDFDLEDVRQLRLRLGRNKANENARYIFTFNPSRRTALDLDRSGAGPRSPGASSTSRRNRDNIRNLSPDVDRRPPCSRRAGRELLPHLRARRTRHPAERHLHELSGRRLSGPVSGLRRRHRASATTTRPPSPASNRLSDRLQVWEILYQSRMTNTDLIAWLKARAGIWYISGRHPSLRRQRRAEPHRRDPARRVQRPPGRQERQGRDRLL